jgi:hypothetical protein
LVNRHNFFRNIISYVKCNSNMALEHSKINLNVSSIPREMWDFHVSELGRIFTDLHLAPVSRNGDTCRNVILENNTSLIIMILLLKQIPLNIIYFPIS